MYRTTSEPSSGDRSTECAQPSSTDASDDIEASIGEASLHPGDQLSTETQVELPSSENFPIDEQSQVLTDPISLSAGLIPSVINDGVQELPAAVEVFIETPTVSEIPADQVTTETAPVQESDISEVLFPVQSTTISKSSYTRAQVKKWKKALALENWIPNYAPCEDDGDWKKPIEDDFSIPERTTEFCFGEHVVSVDVRDLYGVPLLGTGAFGSVYYARIPRPIIVDVAVKRVLRSAKAEVKTLELVATGDHPNIVAYYCTLGHPGTDEMCICMEYMDASLLTFYKAMQQLNPIPFGQVDYLLRRILRDCAQGLFHLQIKGLAHRDIKPANILINWDGVIKLCDFGISIPLAELQCEDTAEKGTKDYIPPIRARDIRDDMWALGLSLVEIVDGSIPLTWTPRVPTSISPQMRACISHLLSIDPEGRPRSYEEILNWPCVSDVSEIPSIDERDFVHYVIGQIPPSQQPD